MALEFFIKNLCIEIQQECLEQEIECHQNFMTYYLNLLSYDPLWNLFPKMKEIVREDAIRLIKYAVAKMQKQQCPCIIALKIQFYFNCNLEDKQDIAEVAKSNFRLRLMPLVEEIIEAKPDDEVLYDMFLRQIVYYSALWRGLGNPTHEEVYKECYQATTSFLDNSDLEAFTEMKVDEKLLQLNEIAQITAGIRLFNWTCKKSGFGIDDLPTTLLKNINLYKDEVSENLQNVVDKIDILTAALDYCFIIEAVEVYKTDGTIIEYRQSCELPTGVEYEEIEYFKDLLVVYRQMEVFLRQLIEINENMMNTYEELGSKFKNCLDKFYSLAHLKAGVPTRIIFPLFLELDQIWEDYQDEITYIKQLYQVMLNLMLYVKDFYISFDRLEMLIDDRDILNDADRSIIAESEGFLEFDDDISEVGVILPSSESFNAEELKLELLGFDIWRLVESQGALIPGNPNYGIVVYENKNYAFSTKESAFMFSKYANRCVNEMIELARKKVELIPLLMLHEDLAKVQTIKQLVSDTNVAQEVVPRNHVANQTETHAIESNIDYNYKWNVWDYKRDAIRLCNLSHAHTTQTNTDTKRGIFSSATQTYDPKDVALQTLKDDYTNTHTPQTYFFGLRGRKDDKQFIIDLTKPPEKS